MVKLILFHPGIDPKQKLYLIYTYCFCYYIDCILYIIKTIKLYLKMRKFNKRLKKMFHGDFNMGHEDNKICIDTHISGGDGTNWKNAYNSLNEWEAKEAGNLAKDNRPGTVYCHIKKMIKPTKKVQKKVKFYRKDIDFIQKQKNKLFQHIIDNHLGFDQVNKILKVAGVLGNSGIDLLDYVTTNIDFIYWYKNQSEKIKKKLSLYEFDE